MTEYVEMPIDTTFRPGDIVVERGYKIVAGTNGGKDTHQELKPTFLRPKPQNPDDEGPKA